MSLLIICVVCVLSKQLTEMGRLDVKLDLSLADLVLTKHPKSEAVFAHRLEIFTLFNVSFVVDQLMKMLTWPLK